jgi:hypothetical protein
MSEFKIVLLLTLLFVFFYYYDTLPTKITICDKNNNCYEKSLSHNEKHINLNLNDIYNHTPSISEQNNSKIITEQPYITNVPITLNNPDIITNKIINPFIPLYPTDPLIGRAMLRDYDYKTLEDPLTPPLKRNDYDIPIPPYSTRGLPNSYKKMGLLVDKNADNNDIYKFMILVGRQKYNNSYYFDYYVTEKNNTSTPLKFELKDMHKELFTGDKVKVHHLNKEYEVIIDNNVGFEYNPYII